MADIVIYYHDPVEVDPLTSWTGICPPLKGARLINVHEVTDPRVTDLFEYARPDAVITVDGQPVVSIEQTQMNPSGHNIPQRFSFHLRAAELGVPSILYYPEFSRRTFSDPNVRYLQVRVPLAQKRLSLLYKIPALSVFWPTDPATKLPDMKQGAHKNIAAVVAALVSNAGKKATLLDLPEIRNALSEMDRVIAKYATAYGQNPSVRQLLSMGFPSAITAANISIDPPKVVSLMKTEAFLSSLSPALRTAQWLAIRAKFIARPLTLVFKGTANKHKNDSEHPWPGYLTLLDVLYARRDAGNSPLHRDSNLVYHLPVDVRLFLSRVNQSRPPTATRIVDTFADLNILTGGVIPGRPMRGETPAFQA